MENINVLNIGLDLGFGFTKVVAKYGVKECEIMFPSLVKQKNNHLVAAKAFAEDDYTVKVNDQLYNVGESALTLGTAREFSNLNFLDTTTIEVLTSSAINLVIEKLDVNKENLIINVASGLPLSHTDKDILSFKTILNNLENTTEINNNATYTKINCTTLFSQGIGVHLDNIRTSSNADSANLQNSIVAYVIIGYKTVELVLLRNGLNGQMLDTELSKTLFGEGCAKFLNIVKEQLKKQSINASIEQIERSILKNNCIMNILGQELDLKDIVDWCKGEYVKDLTSQINKLWEGERGNFFSEVLAGSSASAFHSLFIKDIPNIKLYENNVFGNAWGYLFGMGN